MPVHIGRGLQRGSAGGGEEGFWQLYLLRPRSANLPRAQLVAGYVRGLLRDLRLPLAWLPDGFLVGGRPEKARVGSFEMNSNLVVTIDRRFRIRRFSSFFFFLRE